ncbi:hypothetical protein [Martelella mediterranea]|nr:hypothetical protein [Martelella mediterranea]
MTKPTFDMRISLGNIIAAAAFALSVAGAYYALRSDASANQQDITEIKGSISDLQQSSATKEDVKFLQSRVSGIEAYKDDTIDRMARVETKVDQVLKELQKR